MKNNVNANLNRIIALSFLIFIYCFSPVFATGSESIFEKAYKKIIEEEEGICFSISKELVSYSFGSWAFQNELNRIQEDDETTNLETKEWKKQIRKASRKNKCDEKLRTAFFSETQNRTFFVEVIESSYPVKSYQNVAFGTSCLYLLQINNKNEVILLAKKSISNY